MTLESKRKGCIMCRNARGVTALGNTSDFARLTGLRTLTAGNGP